MAPRIVASARKRGIDDADILHAYRHPIRVHRLDDLDMLVGGDRSGRLLEIGVVVSRKQRIDIIVHAMEARSRFLV